MHIDILSLFPEMFDSPFSHSIIKRAIERGLVSITTHDIRDYAFDKHHTADDYPYGGGAGMVMKPEPIFEAVESVKNQSEGDRHARVVLLTPQGQLLCHHIAQDLAGESNLILLCGHYEGIDERVRDYLVTDEISIGEYILTGGELPAMVLVDAVVRLIPGVLGTDQSAEDDSFANGLLEYPQYTRPRIFRGWEVPPVLLSGNHEEIARWRREQSIKRTLERQPKLLKHAALSEKEKMLIYKVKQES